MQNTRRSRLLLVLCSCLLVAAISTNLVAQPGEQVLPDGSDNWTAEAYGEGWRWAVEKTGNKVLVQPYADPDLPYLIPHGDRTLVKRAEGVHLRIKLHFFSLFRSNQTGVCQTQWPVEICKDGYRRIYGQLVLVWAQPTTEETMKYEFIQLNRTHRIEPGLPPGGVFQPGAGVGPTHGGYGVDTLKTWITDYKNPVYNATFNIPPDPEHPEEPSKGRFMVDAPGFNAWMVVQEGPYHVLMNFDTWLFGIVEQPPPQPPIRFLAGVFSWSFCRAFKMWKLGDVPFYDWNWIATWPVEWNGYGPRPSEYSIRYEKIMGHEFWIPVGETVSPWLPNEQ